MATRRKRRFGYSGCGTDLLVFSVLGVVAVWGVHAWNHAEHRPFGWHRISIPIYRNTKEALLRLLPGRRGEPAPSPTPVAAPSAKPSASPTPAASATPTAPPSATPPPPVADTPPPALPSTAPAEPPPAPAANVIAAVTAAKASIRASAAPLTATASTLLEHGPSLFMGLQDGSVVLRDGGAKTGAGTVVTLPGVEGPVRAIATGADGTLWWISGATGVHLCAYHAADKSARVFDLSPFGPGAAGVNTVAVLAGPGTDQTVLLTTGGAAPILLDAKTGAERDPAALFPADAVTALQAAGAGVFVSDAGSGAERALLLVSGEGGAPATLNLWTMDARQTVEPARWNARPIESAGAGAPPYDLLRISDIGPAAVSVNANGVALLTRAAGGQTLAAGQIWTASLTPQDVRGPIGLHPVATVPDGVFGLWAPPERIGFGRSGLWWTFGGTVFRTGSAGGDTDAYVPWNGAGDDKHGHASALWVDDAGAWVATDTGVHRIIPGHPDPTAGYGGYLRVRLGADAAGVPAGIAQKLDDEMRTWQGVPYKWGGNTKAGIDCSGYVCALYSGVGISIPRGTLDLANGSQGQHVHDELRYGDILVFPGHCAMYIGNGWTTEALDGGVGKAAIWSRKRVVVRRYLK